MVSGKAALDWVRERQSVRVDKASGVVDDANDWAIETMGNPRYPLELFQRVVTASIETQKIVAGLPALDILSETAESGRIARAGLTPLLCQRASVS